MNTTSTDTLDNRVLLASIGPQMTEEIGQTHLLSQPVCKCRKTVEPVVTDTLPKSTIGLRTGVLSSLLHDQLGTSLSQIFDVFNFHLQMKLTAGSLVHVWNRVGEFLLPLNAGNLGEWNH